MPVGAADALRGGFLMVAALVANCQSATPELIGQPSGSAVVSPSGPVTSPGSGWGPLAVIPPQDGTDLARAEGTLLITETCVYLARRDEKMLLFWPADRTRWNDETRAITFSNFDGTLVTVRDRDAVVLGGGGDSEAESGLSAREWARRMVWVAPPDPSCSAERRWGVGIVKR